MIIKSCILKNYKCYQATNINDLFDSDNNIIGITGDNGVGKSSILQGLNTFFNNGKWVRNKPSKKGPGECGVGIIVMGTPSEFKTLKFDYLVISNEYKKKNKIQDEFIYLGVIIYEKKNLQLLYNGSEVAKSEEAANELRIFIKQKFNYIYIDSELDIDDSLNISSDTATLIKGLPIVKEISSSLNQPMNSDGDTIISIINSIVNKYFDTNFIASLKSIDPKYDYKNLTRGATTNLSKELLSQIAVQEIFKNKQLTKKSKGKDIGVSDMSSGQRRIALLDFITVLIETLEKSRKQKIIIGIDEPEISVGSAGRIQQFSRLWQLAEQVNSVLFTTHYYGWINQYSNGKAIHIEEFNDERIVKEYFLDKSKDFPSAPFEMRMIFDFLTSVGSWSEKEPEKKFIIVEGTTDKILINKHNPEIVVIKSRGAKIKEVSKMLYDYSIKGGSVSNLFLLIDTDPGDTESIKGAMEYKQARRISRDENGKVKVVKKNQNLSNKAEIEDLILGIDFLAALNKSIDKLEKKDDQNFIKNIKIKYPDQTGVISFGLDQMQLIEFDRIFKGDFKVNTFINYIPSDQGKKIFKSLFKL